MLFNMSYYIGISIVLTIVSVVFIFIWRKISDNEMYIKVLEKKLTNLKKENNVFRQIIDQKNSEDVTMEMAENIMNDVFGEHKCTNDKCDISFAEVKESNDVKVEEVSECNDLDEEQPVGTIEDEIDNIVSETSGTYSKTSLNKMSVEKIRDICKEMELSTVGNKNTLIDRILSE